MCIEVEGKRYTCKYCGKEFDTRQSLGAHILNIHKSKKYECNICGKVLYGEQNYKRHQYFIHTPYKCECCGKLVLTKYGSGRFCSSKCSKHREISKEQRKRISDTLRERYKKIGIKPKNKCKDCGKIISYYAVRCISCNNKILKIQNKGNKKNSYKTSASNDILNNKVFYGYIYLVENLVNGSVYIGQHFTKINDLKNRYFGSGIYLKKALKKYGKENFRKIILFEGSCTQNQIDELEKYYIWLAKNNNIGVQCYNIAIGGRGNNKRYERFIW